VARSSTYGGFWVVSDYASLSRVIRDDATFTSTHNMEDHVHPERAARRRAAEVDVRITFDRDRCSGHARCAALAPEVYRLDEEGYLGEPTLTEGSERQAERGAMACPEGAITVQP
jgi:ferredoxin